MTPTATADVSVEAIARAIRLKIFGERQLTYSEAERLPLAANAVIALFHSALPDTTSQNNAEKLPNREAAAGLPGREALVDVLHAHNDEVTREQNYMCADAILSLLSAPGGTWHGIESAPRDGKNVVLYHKIHGEMEGHFESCREWEHHELGKQYDGALWILGDDIYQEAVEEGPSGEFFDGQITHWRLPSPPSTGKGSGQCP